MTDRISVAEYHRLTASRPPSKYRAVPTVVDGIRFASRKEARRYGELTLLQRAGQISELQAHPRFELTVRGFHICAYVGDFSYRQFNNLVVEDVKSKPTRTQSYLLKAKLMQAIYNIVVQEV